MERENLLDLIPAYALGALDPAEEKAVANLLATDVEAQELFADYTAISAFLPLAVPAMPAPAHLEADLRQKLAHRRTTPAPTVTTVAPVKQVTPFPLVAMLGSVAAIVVVVLGLFFVLNNQQDNSAETLFNQLAVDSNAQRFAIQAVISDSINGEMVVGRDGQQAVIRVNALPEIGSDQTFQMWLIDENGVQSGGIFSFINPQEQNFVIVPLPRPASTFTTVGVSIEPEGGSPLIDRPTGPRVFAIPLSQS